jgi:hypothetical protein
MNNSFNISNLNQSAILNNSSNQNTIINTNISNISLKKSQKSKKTFQEIQKSFLNSLNLNIPFEIPNKNIPFDDYVDVINTSMSHYQLNDIPKKKKMMKKKIQKLIYKRAVLFLKMIHY